MNAQTDRRSWLPWLAAISGTIFFGYVITLLRPWGFYWSRIAPWENAHLVYDLAVVEKISANMPHHYIFWSERLGALIGIVMLFVIGPSLWIFSESANGESGTDWKLFRSVGWYAGVMIIMAGLWYGINSSVNSIRHSHIIQKVSTYQTAQSRLRYDLMTKALKAADIFYMPRSDGGAGGRFRMVDLDDLIPYRQNGDSEFIAGTLTSDSVLTFYAVGDVKGKDPGFKNFNGEIGKVQLALRVNPTNPKLVTWLDDRYVN